MPIGVAQSEWLETYVLVITSYQRQDLVIIAGINLIERPQARGEPLKDLTAAVPDGAQRAAELFPRRMAFPGSCLLTPRTSTSPA